MNHVTVKEYRQNFLEMIRFLYKEVFFPNLNNFRRNPRDVSHRLRDVPYSEEQLEKLKFVTNSDYRNATEAFARTIEGELFQGFICVQNQSELSLVLKIPHSKI